MRTEVTDGTGESVEHSLFLLITVYMMVPVAAVRMSVCMIVHLYSRIAYIQVTPDYII